MSAEHQRRSRSQRWPAVRPLIAPVPANDARATDVDDALTRMAIEERTWPSRELDIRTIPGPRRRRPSAPLDTTTRYELGALIGRGGMGEVFAAFDTQIGREVAIKRLHPHKITPASRARFLREARIQGWLEHPSIPSVHELGSDDQGRPFFVMKRLSGITLHEVLASRDKQPHYFTEQQLLRAFVEICLAIEFAHTRGVLHRDLKPANILLGEFGEVYVLDWGVAQVLDESVACMDETRHTLQQDAYTDGALGTPGYMSPEQVRGDQLDGRADVYALGCLLFEILVGQRLHPDGVAGLTSALAGTSASASQLRPNLPPELDVLCLRATATERAERISSARGLGEAVQRYLDGDRDVVRRRELSRTHLDQARRAASYAPALAMREAGRALALDPTQPGAAELVGHLMLRPPAQTPAAVLAELEEARLPEQRDQAKLAIAVYAGYACLVPVALAFGIRDAFYLSALLGVAGCNIALAAATLLRRRAVPRILVALAQAAMFAALARIFTPLFIAPGVAAVTLMAYAQHPTTRRHELVVAGVLAIVAVLGAWAAEAFGLVTATTIVEGGTIHLRPPLDGVAEFPIVPALCCYTVVLLGVAAEVAYAGAQRRRAAQRELHVQAWSLRQLVSLDS